jgi:UDP-N-acetylmuramoylalanine--D-glutamate ligase
MVALWDGRSAVDLFSRDVVHLRGDHNLLNVLAACAIAKGADVSPEAMRAGVEGFSGVEHRLEFVRSWGGAEWYNDSIATAPERAMAAIRSFDQPLVLLAGGRDKDLPWNDFASLVHQRVDHVVMFGEARDIVSRAIGDVVPNQRPYTVDRCENLEEAIQTAAKIVQPGDVVLLSPGGTSFDEFRDFAERGEWFRKWVKMLP